MLLYKTENKNSAKQNILKSQSNISLEIRMYFLIYNKMFFRKIVKIFNLIPSLIYYFLNELAIGGGVMRDQDLS